MPLTASIRIDPARGKTPINPHIFGQFLEHFHRQVYGGVFDPSSPLSGPDGLREDVIAALRDELRVPIVRWPGGCFVSAYHWKDGVGPRRVPAYDKAWRVEDPNTFGSDEFTAWCRRIGAEAYICTNAGTGTPEEMSDWVEYCNLTEAGQWARLRAANGSPLPHTVRFWSIGNENYGGWEMGAKTAQEWGRFVLESAKMMKRVDPSIRLLAAALPDLDWTLNLLRQAGPLLDMVSIHGYYDPLWQKDELSGYAACVQRAGEVENAIRLTEEVISVAGCRGQVAIAFDEWNLRGWHHPDGNSPAALAARDRNDRAATYSMADAVFSASFLNTCLRHAATVQMANMAPVVNTRGPLYVHPGGIVRRTTFHVMAMYANLLAPFAADSFTRSDSLDAGLQAVSPAQAVPALDAAATCDDSMRSWRLALVNRHPSQPVQVQVSFDGQPIAGSFAAVLLEGDSPDAYNDIENPERVRPQPVRLEAAGGILAVPAHALMVVTVER